jgi:hypothetical protein
MLDVKGRWGRSAGEDGSSHFNYFFLPLMIFGYDILGGGENLSANFELVPHQSGNFYQHPLGLAMSQLVKL